jgi:c-di-GMP-binding flagellar brake protein YcgR
MKKYKAGNERRQSVRIRVYWLVKHAPEPDFAPFRAENIKNISRGGLAFYSDHALRTGTLLKLYFQPPKSKKPVEAQGTVVRCASLRGDKTFEIGIQFLDISEEAKTAIEELEASFYKRQRKTRS